MDNLVASITSISQLSDILEPGLYKLLSDLDSLDNALVKTVELLGMIQNGMNPMTRVAYPHDGTDIMTAEKKQTETGLLEDKEKNGGDEGSGLFETVEKIQKTAGFVNTSLELAEKFGELTPALEKIKHVSGLIHNLGEGAMGVEKLMGAGELTMTEGVAAGGELMEGMIGTAGIAADFGPPGWIAALGLLAVSGGVAYYEHSEQEDKKRAAAKAIKDERTQEALSTFRFDKNSADELMTRLDTHFIRNKLLPGTHYDGDLAQVARNALVKNNPYALDPSIPVYPTSDHTGAVLNLLPDEARRVADENNATLLPENYLKQTNALREHLMQAAYDEGLPGFMNVAKKAIETARKYDKEHHSKMVTTVEHSIEERLYTLMDESGRSRNSIRKPGMANGAGIAREGQGNTVTINLNRPMIENFSIHSSGTEAGLADLKKKVEEILIDILEKAGAIR